MKYKLPDDVLNKRVAARLTEGEHLLLKVISRIEKRTISNIYREMTVNWLNEYLSNHDLTNNPEAMDLYQQWT